MWGLPGHDGVFPPYPAVIGSLPLGDDIRAVTARGTFTPVDTVSLVSDLPSGMGSEGPVRAGLLQPRANSNPKDSKKRKSETITQDEPNRAKRAKYSTPQVPDLQQGNVQVNILNSRPFQHRLTGAFL